MGPDSAAPLGVRIQRTPPSGGARNTKKLGPRAPNVPPPPLARPWCEGAVALAGLEPSADGAGSHSAGTAPADQNASTGTSVVYPPRQNGRIDTILLPKWPI